MVGEFLIKIKILLKNIMYIISVPTYLQYISIMEGTYKTIKE